MVALLSAAVPVTLIHPARGAECLSRVVVPLCNFNSYSLLIHPAWGQVLGSGTVHKLREQYRMHPAAARLVSDLFYQVS